MSRKLVENYEDGVHVTAYCGPQFHQSALNRTRIEIDDGKAIVSFPIWCAETIGLALIKVAAEEKAKVK